MAEKEQRGMPIPPGVVEKSRLGNQRSLNLDILENCIKYKLDALEEYEEKSEMDLYIELNELMDDCVSMWGTDAMGMKYLTPMVKILKYLPSAGLIDMYLDIEIKKKGYNREDIPLIPIIEYKLVPTGHVEYFDARLTRKQRETRRYHNNSAGRKTIKRLNDKGNAKWGAIGKEQRVKAKAEREKLKQKESESSDT